MRHRLTILRAQKAAESSRRNKDVTVGFVYVAAISSCPDIVKIGATRGSDPEGRVYQVLNDMVTKLSPGARGVQYSYAILPVPDRVKTEAAVHSHFDAQRAGRVKIFRVPFDAAVDALTKMAEGHHEEP